MICWQNDPADAEGHHIIEHSVDGPSGLKNFTTLCRDCHSRYHRGEFKINFESF
ncbi:HNH endonuclease [Loktanella fryxellensis]|uniref:HNH endonuclease n=1 Tax=Loktanella fryxellensis TaxID=245187 RepID=UPI000B7F21A8